MKITNIFEGIFTALIFTVVLWGMVVLSGYPPFVKGHYFEFLFWSGLIFGMAKLNIEFIHN